MKKKNTAIIEKILIAIGIIILIALALRIFGVF